MTQTLTVSHRNPKSNLIYFKLILKTTLYFLICYLNLLDISYLLFLDFLKVQNDFYRYCVWVACVVVTTFSQRFMGSTKITANFKIISLRVSFFFKKGAQTSLDFLFLSIPFTRVFIALYFLQIGVLILGILLKNLDFSNVVGLLTINCLSVCCVVRLFLYSIVYTVRKNESRKG